MNTNLRIIVGHEWSHSSPPPQSHSSPDTTSPMYPDRLIRPLPKRRLRSRLSEEEAKTIEFPPNPPQVAPLFNLPHVDRPHNYAVRAPRGEVDDHECSCGVDHGVRQHGADVEGLDGTHERVGRRTGFGDAPLEQDGHYQQAWEHQPGSYGKPPPPPSTTSSADGYESFENTNNKKKRKIPLSGGTHHHSSLSAEMVNMSLSNPAHESSLAEDTAGVGAQYYGQSSGVHHASPGTGISGAGRGRYGRPRPSLDRRPLGASTNGLNAYSGSGNPKSKNFQDKAECTCYFPSKVVCPLTQIFQHVLLIQASSQLPSPMLLNKISFPHRLKAMRTPA